MTKCPPRLARLANQRAASAGHPAVRMQRSANSFACALPSQVTASTFHSSCTVQAKLKYVLPYLNFHKVQVQHSISTSCTGASLKNCISGAALAMERNLTQREYEELNSRREAAGRPPLSYRDANRQARRPTTRERQARQQGVGIEGSGTEVSSEARARPPTPPRPKRQRDERGSSSQTYTWTGDWWGQDWGAWSWQDTHWWEHQDSAAAATAANQRLSRQTQSKMLFGSWMKWRSLLMRRSAH